ncbi:MAG TPA: hypothetical protein VN420_00580 [Candidatus Fimivivens sp.]|nr:hypothetical protein [Candidatus Fimivivens sp.]
MQNNQNPTPQQLNAAQQMAENAGLKSEVEIGLLIEAVRQTMAKWSAKYGAWFLAAKIFLVVETVCYLLGCVIASHNHWKGVPELLFLGSSLVDVLVATSVRAILTAGLMNSTIAGKGLPKMTIGQLFTAPFSADAKWPDFDTEKYAKEFLGGVRGLGFIVGYWIVVKGLVAIFSNLVPISSFAGVVILLAGVVVLAVFSFVDKAPQSPWFKRIVITMGILEVLYGVVVTAYWPTRTETEATSILARNQTNRDLRNVENLARLKRKVESGEILTSEEVTEVRQREIESGAVAENAKATLAGTTVEYAIPANIAGPLAPISLPAGRYKWDIDGDAVMIMRTPYREEPINLKDDRKAGMPWDNPNYQGCGMMIGGTARGLEIVSTGPNDKIPVSFNTYSGLRQDLNQNVRGVRPTKVVLRFRKQL